MEPNSIFNTTVLAQGILSNVAFNLVLIVFGLINRDLKLYNFKFRDSNLMAGAIKKIIYVAVLNILFLLLMFFTGWISDTAVRLAIATSALVVLAYIFYILFGCWTIFKRMYIAGISEVDDTVEGGITYKKSLDLSDQSIRFLGVGAHKLTQLDEFHEAIERCEQNGTGEKSFLICDPRSAALAKMEQRNQQNQGNYKEKIIETLREILKLKSQHYNIKVYLYSSENIEDIPVFRLFFINSDSVLVSFYAVNRNNDAGKKLPQIRFTRTGNNSTFFFAFENYYKNILSSSQECVDIQNLIDSVA